jgi:hypothetical protein
MFSGGAGGSGGGAAGAVLRTSPTPESPAVAGGPPASLPLIRLRNGAEPLCRGGGWGGATPSSPTPRPPKGAPYGRTGRGSGDPPRAATRFPGAAPSAGGRRAAGSTSGGPETPLAAVRCRCSGGTGVPRRPRHPFRSGRSPSGPGVWGSGPLRPLPSPGDPPPRHFPSIPSV